MTDYKNCQLCGSSALVLKYRGAIRTGFFGKISEDAYSILQCQSCAAAFLSPQPQTVYEDETYRQAYNDSAEIEAYFRLHDRQQIRHLEIFRNTDLRDKTVADFGSGGGSFLDYLHTIAARTIAIEPYQNYHSSLKARGHDVYSYGIDFLNAEAIACVDIAVSLHVIEHLSEPLTYLREIHACLADGGLAYLLTPNHSDILLDLDFASYAPFFYRSAHLWYFNAESLQWLAQSAGFSSVAISYQANYDLSNAMAWLRDKKPTGLGYIPSFDARIDDAWRSFLESSGKADCIWAILKK